MTPGRQKAFPQQRRGSSRRASGSSSYSIPKSPGFDSPRTLCPKDSDAFSYDPNHLRAWYIPNELWEPLPVQMQDRLVAVQHSGAAVLTGFERLARHEEGTTDRPSLSDSQTLRDIQALQAASSPSFFQSPISSSPTSSMTSSPALSAFGNSGHISPMSLSSEIHPPQEIGVIGRPRQRSFSTPMEPRDAYYTMELSHLRTESLVRLRHAALKVDSEWYETKRLGAVSQDYAIQFEKWWAEKKNWIKALDEEIKLLSHAMGVSSSGLGWSVTTCP